MNLYSEEQKRENEIETEKWAQEKQIDESRQIGEDEEETKEWEDEKKKDIDE